MYNRISQDKAWEMMNTEKDYIILDVRTKAEYDGIKIKGAINLPLEDIDDEDILNVDKDKMIFVYCRSGHRSMEASARLEKLGYKNIYEMGGIMTWEHL